MLVVIEYHQFRRSFCLTSFMFLFCVSRLLKMLKRRNCPKKKTKAKRNLAVQPEVEDALKEPVNPKRKWVLGFGTWLRILLEHWRDVKMTSPQFCSHCAQINSVTILNICSRIFHSLKFDFLAIKIKILSLLEASYIKMSRLLSLSPKT